MHLRDFWEFQTDCLNSVIIKHFYPAFAKCRKEKVSKKKNNLKLKT